MFVQEVCKNTKAAMPVKTGFILYERPRSYLPSN